MYGHLQSIAAPRGNWRVRARTPILPVVETQRIGEYEVLGELGRGGMGVVYRVRHSAHEQPLALKVLLEANPRRHQRFTTEARVMQFLGRNPHILGLRELGLEGGASFLVMDLLEGEPFDDYLRKEPPREEALSEIHPEVAEIRVSFQFLSEIQQFPRLFLLPQKGAL